MQSNGENSLTDNDAMNRVFLRHAYQYASAHSKDPSTQLGAILVKPNVGIVSWGVNNIPEKLKNTKDRWEYPKKKQYVEHAERNALYKCTSRAICTAGMVMYCPWFACADCARAIIQCGIIGVVGHKEIYELTNDRWKETTDIGISILKEAGVKCTIWSGKIGNGLSVRVNGTEFHP